MVTTESNSITLSIVIPVYNEQDTIGEVIEQVSNVDLGSVAKEIIISDDGSTAVSYTHLRAHETS